MALPDVADIQAFIDQIKVWYNNDERGFATYFDAAVANVKPIPEGTDPAVIFDWQGATVDTLCAFFQERNGSFLYSHARYLSPLPCPCIWPGGRIS
jgi:hypothetical protein